MKSPTAYNTLAAAILTVALIGLSTTYFTKRASSPFIIRSSNPSSPSPVTAASRPAITPADQSHPAAASPTSSASPTAAASPSPTQPSPAYSVIPRPPGSPSGSPAVVPSPSPTPSPQPIAEWATCRQIGSDYRILYAFETQHFYVNLCRRGNRLIYKAESKTNPDDFVQLPAYAVDDRGYQANHRNTSYRIAADADGFIWLQVLLNHHLMREERSLYRVELPKILPPKPIDPIVEWQACNQMGEDYREFYSFETATYYISVCQQNDRFYYLGQAKSDLDDFVQVSAQQVRLGVFTARNGNLQFTTADYRNLYGATADFELIIVRNGQIVARETSLRNTAAGSDWLSTDLTCTGALQTADLTTDLSFSVDYSPENGFKHVEFRRKPSNELAAEARLTYSGQDRTGRDRFRGTVDGATVTVLDLSTHYVQAGTQVSVSYDGQWGHGTCR